MDNGLSNKNIDSVAALNHLAQADVFMFERVAYACNREPALLLPVPKTPREYFPTLVRSIISQQISTKAAAAIYQRLRSQCTLLPKKISQLSVADLHQCGLTRKKAEYVLALAQNWRTLQVTEFAALSDSDITKRLTQQYGIGVWTAQMFLLFAMARSDVFAIGDLGLRQQVAAWYSVSPNDHTAIEQIAERWSPHRSVASLTLWFHIDNGPVLL